MRSPALHSLLGELRQHPAFPELLAAVPAPFLSRFKASQAASAGDATAAHARWIHESGKLAQHEAWVELLSGRPAENLTKT